MRMLTLTAALVISSMSSQAISNEELMQEILKCQEDKIAELIAANQKDFVSQEMSENCQPGRYSGIIPSCGGRGIKANTHIYTAPDGAEIESAQWRASSQTERTGATKFQFNSKTSSVLLNCDGHGCDGKGRVWITGNIVGKLKYIPTETDRNAVLAECLKISLGG